ncbi:hypothetical protein ACFZFR_000641 [Salmonella enterica]
MFKSIHNNGSSNIVFDMVKKDVIGCMDDVAEYREKIKQLSEVSLQFSQLFFHFEDFCKKITYSFFVIVRKSWLSALLMKIPNIPFLKALIISPELILMGLLH